MGQEHSRELIQKPRFLTCREACFLIAARRGDHGKVREHLRSGVNVDARNGHGWSALHLAAGEGHKAVVQVLIDEGKSLVDPLNKLGETPLHIACKFGHFSVVSVLLNAGANVYANECGFTSLVIAVEQNHVEIVRLLLNYEAGWKSMFRYTPLEIAAIYEHNEVEDVLRGKDCIKKFRGLLTETTEQELQFLCNISNGNLSQVLESLQSGISPNTKHVNGWSALHIASKSGHEDVVQLLIDNGAIVDVLNKNSCTPLQVACRAGHYPIVKLLLDNGANVNGHNTKGTPLFHAAGGNHVSIVKLLLKHGADQKLAHSEEFSTMNVALGQGNEKVVEVLMEYEGKDEEVRQPPLDTTNTSQQTTDEAKLPTQEPTIESKNVSENQDPEAMKHEDLIIQLLRERNEKLKLENEYLVCQKQDQDRIHQLQIENLKLKVENCEYEMEICDLQKDSEIGKMKEHNAELEQKLLMEKEKYERTLEISEFQLNQMEILKEQLQNKTSEVENLQKIISDMELNLKMTNERANYNLKEMLLFGMKNVEEMAEKDRKIMELERREVETGYEIV